MSIINLKSTGSPNPASSPSRVVGFDPPRLLTNRSFLSATVLSSTKSLPVLDSCSLHQTRAVPCRSCRGSAVASSDVQRKLTAILFADMVGYSRLMGENEKATPRMLTESRQVFAGYIAKFRGRIVNAPVRGCSGQSRMGKYRIFDGLSEQRADTPAHLRCRGREFAGFSTQSQPAEFPRRRKAAQRRFSLPATPATVGTGQRNLANAR